MELRMDLYSVVSRLSEMSLLCVLVPAKSYNGVDENTSVDHDVLSTEDPTHLTSSHELEITCIVYSLSSATEGDHFLPNQTF